MFGFKFTQKKKVRDASNIDRELIARAYKRREKDLQSLKDYDMGKKNIDAPNLSSSF